MKSLKTKFSTIVASLIIVVIAATAGTLVFQKKVELEADIYRNARSFAELTAEDITSISNQFLPSQSFLFFNRELTTILKKNPDIEGVKIYNFNGDVLYDFEEEKTQQYSGTLRTVDAALLPRIKSPNLSLLTKSGDIIFLEKLDAGEYELIDENGSPISTKLFGQMQNIIVPVDNEYAVEYDLTYKNLISRLFTSAANIGIIAAIGIFISLVLGLFMAGIVTGPIKKLTEVVGDIAKGDFAKRVDIKSKDEVGLLADSVNKMATDLEAATEARIFEERVKKELEIAANIQQELLPKELPQIAGIQIAGQIWPATEVGGDVYDVITDDKGNTYMYVGDVTGHGVPAGIISAIANATIVSTITDGDVIGTVTSVNHVLRTKTAKNLFLTLLLLKYDAKGTVSYVNAGHEQVLHYKASSQVAEITNPGGIALGLFDDVADKLTEDTVAMQLGDVLVIYSDGIPEAWANEKDQFGMERFQQALIKAASGSAEQIKESIYQEVKTFMGTYEQKDDITLLVIKKS